MWLPPELVEKVVLNLDPTTLETVYNSRVVHTFVSEACLRVIEKRVLQQAQENHKKLLLSCLACLPWHVWNDGTPMKNRGVVRFKGTHVTADRRPEIPSHHTFDADATSNHQMVRRRRADRDQGSAAKPCSMH